MPLSMFIGRCTGYGSRPDDPVLHRCVLPQIGIATLELLERLGVDVVHAKDADVLWSTDGNQRML